MSETANVDGINIQINNADSNTGGGSFLDRILDIGLKFLIPLGIVLALVIIGGILIVVPKILSFVGDISDLGLGQFLPLFAPIGGLGALAGWLIGKN
jgi:hypothetical protein